MYKIEIDESGEQLICFDNLYNSNNQIKLSSVEENEQIDEYWCKCALITFIIYYKKTLYYKILLHYLSYQITIAQVNL